MGMLLLAGIEFTKLKRCNIFCVGFVTLLFAPLIPVLQQLSFNEPALHFGFQALVNGTIWYNTSLFLPVTILFLGGYMINREYTEDTLKNMYMIPVTHPMLICGKLTALAVMTILYGMYSSVLAVFISAVFFPEGLSPVSAAIGSGRIVIAGLCLYIAVMPVLCWCSGRKNRFMAAAVPVFLYGFLGIPLAGHGLQDYYPVTAGLTLVHYNGSVHDTLPYHPITAITVLSAMAGLSFVILQVQGRRAKVDKSLKMIRYS